MYNSVLDNCSLLSNYKNRYGLNIRKSSVTSVYIKQKNLRRFLEQKFLFYIENKIERNKYVDWIVFKCEEAEIIEKVNVAFEEDELNAMELMLKNLKKFWMYIKSYDI